MRWLLVLFLAACGGPDPAADEPCRDDGGSLRCPHHTVTIAGDLTGRAVHYKAPPLRAPPDAGWPTVLLFQGSFFSAGWMWAGGEGDALGARHQTETIAGLLDAGFLVVTPEAHVGGSGYWDTNVVGWAGSWEASPDHAFMQAVLAALAEGRFGPADPTRLFAAGISSGGYMTSRMAVSYRGRFRALAIHSASYATCSGPLCEVPALPEDHPPTLFLHGAKDGVVPLATMRTYRDALLAAGHEAPELVDPEEGHAWLAAAPEAIRDFFTSH